jgi:hypothetical protein
VRRRRRRRAISPLSAAEARSFEKENGDTRYYLSIPLRPAPAVLIDEKGAIA